MDFDKFFGLLVGVMLVEALLFAAAIALGAQIASKPQPCGSNPQNVRMVIEKAKP